MKNDIQHSDKIYLIFSRKIKILLIANGVLLIADYLQTSNIFKINFLETFMATHFEKITHFQNALNLIPYQSTLKKHFKVR